MNKKVKSIILAMGLVLCMGNKSIYAENIPIKVNDTVLQTETLFEDGRVLIPVRIISENLGCNVYWNEEKQQVMITRQEKEVTFTINQDIMVIKNYRKNTKEDIKLDKAPKLIDNRTYVPLRALEEALNDKIKWDEASRTVYIESDYIKNINVATIKRTFEVLGMSGEGIPEKIEVEVPILKSGHESINDYFKKKSHEEIQYMEDKMHGIYGEGYNGEYRYELQYDKANIFSISAERKIYAGGGMFRLADEKLKSFGYVFNKDTGYKLEITDILKGEMNDIKEHIKSEFQKMIDNNVAVDFNGTPRNIDFEINLNTTFKDLVFYVNNKELVFTLDIFDGAYMDVGTIKYKININDNKDLFTQEFLTNYYINQ